MNSNLPGAAVASYPVLDPRLLTFTVAFQCARVGVGEWGWGRVLGGKGGGGGLGWQMGWVGGLCRFWEVGG